MLDCGLRIWVFYKYSSQSLSVVLAKSLQCLEVSFFWWGEGGCQLSHFTEGGTETKL